MNSRRVCVYVCVCENPALFLGASCLNEETTEVTCVDFPEAPDEEAETVSDPHSWVKCNNLAASYWLTDSQSVGLMSLSDTTTSDKSGSFNTMTYTQYLSIWKLPADWRIRPTEARLLMPAD